MQVQRYNVLIEDTAEVVSCPTNENVLRAMEVLGRKGIPVGCRGGGCGVCKVEVTSGHFRVKKMSREAISVEEEAAGIVLACKLFPESDLSMRVIGKMVGAVTGKKKE